MRCHRNRIETGCLRKRLERPNRERPETVDIVMGIWTAPEDHIRCPRDRDFRPGSTVEDDDLGVGLADIENGDASKTLPVHGIWKTVMRSLWTGELSRLVAMMSAICAHHLFITG